MGWKSRTMVTAPPHRLRMNPFASGSISNIPFLFSLSRIGPFIAPRQIPLQGRQVVDHEILQVGILLFAEGTVRLEKRPPDQLARGGDETVDALFAEGRREGLVEHGL